MPIAADRKAIVTRHCADKLSQKVKRACTVARSASEGQFAVKPRLRFGLVLRGDQLLELSLADYGHIQLVSLVEFAAGLLAGD